MKQRNQKQKMKFAIFTVLFAGACVAFPQLSPSSSDSCIPSGVESLLGELEGPIQELSGILGELLTKIISFLLL